MKFEYKLNSFHSGKRISKCHLQNDVQFFLRNNVFRNITTRQTHWQTIGNEPVKYFGAFLDQHTILSILNTSSCYLKTITFLKIILLLRLQYMERNVLMIHVLFCFVVVWCRSVLLPMSFKVASLLLLLASCQWKAIWVNMNSYISHESTDTDMKSTIKQKRDKTVWTLYCILSMCRVTHCGRPFLRYIVTSEIKRGNWSVTL